jgi:hypothetical protein
MPFLVCQRHFPVLLQVDWLVIDLHLVVAARTGAAWPASTVSTAIASTYFIDFLLSTRSTTSAPGLDAAGAAIPLAFRSRFAGRFVGQRGAFRLGLRRHHSGERHLQGNEYNEKKSNLIIDEPPSQIIYPSGRDQDGRVGK